MSLLEVDGNAIATLVCEPAALALPPVLRVNVADGYERDSGRWARLRGRCFLVPSDADGRARLEAYCADLAKPDLPIPTGKLRGCSALAMMDDRRPSSRPPSPGTGAPCVCSTRPVL